MSSSTQKTLSENGDASSTSLSPNVITSFSSRLGGIFVGCQQMWSTILCALLSAFLIVLIALYASDAALSTGIRFVYASGSNTIFVLSALSGLNGLFLAATIQGAIERLQWILVVRPRGLRFLKFLCLDAGTGIYGLLLLSLLGARLPLVNSTRFAGLIKLISIITVPILGVLIMSDVNTIMRFQPISQSQPTPGWGMRPFNASLGNNVSVVGDQIIGGLFLQDKARAIDISSSSFLEVPCSNSPQRQSNSRCERTFLVPGGVDCAAAPFANDTTGADFFLAKDQQGYVLQFQEGDPDWVFNDVAECSTFGFPFAGFRLCLRNAQYNNTLQARVLECPSSIFSSAGCFSNTTWHSDAGWQASLNTSFVNASVAYSKLNGTMVSYELSSTPQLVEVSGYEMLGALHAALGNFSGGIQDVLPILAQPEKLKLFPFYVYPVWIWGFLRGAETLAPDDPAFFTRGADTIQSMLTMILYFGSPGVYVQALRASNVVPGNSTDISIFTAEINAATPPDTQIYLANLRY